MTIKDITDTLPVHPTRKYRKRYLDSIEYIVLHHTGGDGTPEGFAKYHVSKGWPGIGYHYVIDKNATIYQTNRVDTISYNVANTNTKVLGIAVVGNYNDEELSSRQRLMLRRLIHILKILVGDKPVKGHNEFKATECPGKNITEFIKQLN